MDIAHNVRSCTVNLNCDHVPITGILLGVDGGRKGRNVNRDSKKFSQIRATASKLSSRRNSSLQDENQSKLCSIISSDNATEGRTPGDHGLQSENSKASGTSQTESTSDSVANKAKRSNNLKVRSGKSGHAQPHQLTQKNKYSGKAADSNRNPIQPVKRNGDQLHPASAQVLGVKASTEPPKYSSKSSSRAWQAKEKKEPSKGPSNLFSNMSSSHQVHRGQLSQKRNCSAEAVKKSRTQTQAVKTGGNKIPPTPEQEKERKEALKYSLHLSIEMRAVNRVHRGQAGQKSKCSEEAVKKSKNQRQAVKTSGNQIPSTSKQKKEKEEPSKGPSIFPTKTNSCDPACGGQPVQKIERSAEAVKKRINQTQVVRKSGNQKHPTARKEKEKEPSKGPSNLSTKLGSSNQVRRGPNQKRKSSSEAVENSLNQSETVKKSRNKLPATPKQVWQVKRQTASSQDSGKTSSKVHQVKKKTSTLSSKTSSSHAKQRHHRQHQRQLQRSRSISPEHYIKLDGFVKLGHNCSLCENDLAHSPLPVDEDLESDKLPDVAILPCGHAFHILCLEQGMSEDELKDPSCFICASLQ